VPHRAGDQADRLRTTGLEQLRDFFDRSDLGLILIGMPGFDRQLARYPQLYSRIGFAHQYQPLDPDDIPTVLAQYWDQLGQAFDPSNTDHAETVSAVKQITGGNFRLIERLIDSDRPCDGHQPTGGHHPRRRPRRPADLRHRRPVSQIARPK